MSKQKYPKFTTPLVGTKFPYFVKPDDGKKIDADPSWKATLLLDPSKDGVQEFLDFLDAELDKAVEALHEEKPKSKKYEVVKPYYDDEDKEGNETGLIAVNVKRKTQRKDRKTGEMVDLEPPPLFDASGQRCYPKNVYGGSQVIVAGHLFPYAMASTKKIGLSVKLDGVQIIELVEGGQQTADSLGFTAQEGYAGDTLANAGANYSDADDAEEDDDNDDF